MSPALELIDVARQLDQSSALRQRVENWNAATQEQMKAKIAFLAAMAMHEGDAATAERSFRTLSQLSDASENGTERHSEVLAIHAAAICDAAAHDAENFRPTQELARELANSIYEDAMSGRWPATEPWKRHLAAMQRRLEFIGTETENLLLKQPRSWVSVSRMTSETRGNGYPPASWTIDNGTATHIVGHDDDYLYFVSPLTGDFSVEGDFSTFDYRDIHPGFGGYWTGVSHERTHLHRGLFRWGFGKQSISPPLTRMFDTMRVRMDVRDGILSTWINGRRVSRRQQTSLSDPWLSIHSWWMTYGSVQNLRILRDPVIPKQIHLLNGQDLAGWFPYFDESVGGEGLDWHLRPAPSPEHQNADEHRELIGTRRNKLSGTHFESLLRYHRPIVEDGIIDYEFFYNPGETHVHPAIDRLVFLLTPDSVDLHWASDAKHDLSNLSPSNRFSIQPSTGLISSVPLKPSAWNHVALDIKGDMVNVSVNQQPIVAYRLHAENQRVFGLFHYADQTEARVRNIRWKGAWPQHISAPVDQELAHDGLESLLADTASLPAVLDHHFTKAENSSPFVFVDGQSNKAAQRTTSGLRVTREGGNYVNHIMTTSVTMNGDFDVVAEFEDWQSTAEEGGEGSVQLTVAIAGSSEVLCNLSRKLYVFPNDQEHIIQPSVFHERNGTWVPEFFEGPPEESTSGKLRMVRRGTQLYFLYAESDSTEFRLIHQQPVSKAAATPRLSVGHHKSGSTTVTWKRMTVRSENADDTAPLTLAELNQHRDQLSARAEVDFLGSQPSQGTKGLQAFQIWGEERGKFRRDANGLQITAPGANEWTAVGLAPKFSMVGDFDISLQLRILKLAPPADGDDSAVLLQTEFSDPSKSASEIRFSRDSAGRKTAHVFHRMQNTDGSANLKETHRTAVDNVVLLRLARVKDLLYHVMQPANNDEPVILHVAPVGTGPVPATFLRALIHTGGDNRESVVELKKLTVHAHSIE